jgi:hypothetical protein
MKNFEKKFDHIFETKDKAFAAGIRGLTVDDIQSFREEFIMCLLQKLHNDDCSHLFAEFKDRFKITKEDVVSHNFIEDYIDFMIDTGRYSDLDQREDIHSLIFVKFIHDLDIWSDDLFDRADDQAADQSDDQAATAAIYSRQTLISKLCIIDNLPLIKWFYERFDYSPNDLRGDTADIEYDEIFHTACGGNIKLADWIAETAGIHSDDASIDNILDAIMQTEYDDHISEGIQWLIRKFKPELSVIEYYYNIFEYACSNNNLELLKCIIEKYELDQLYVRYNLYAFQTACELGHFTVAQWLIDNYDLTLDDAINKNDTEDVADKIKKMAENGDLQFNDLGPKSAAKIS